MILEDALGDRGMHDANDLPAVKATLDDLFHRAAGGASPMRWRWSIRPTGLRSPMGRCGG